MERKGVHVAKSYEKMSGALREQTESLHCIELQIPLVSAATIDRCTERKIFDNAKNRPTILRD